MRLGRGGARVLLLIAVIGCSPKGGKSSSTASQPPSNPPAGSGGGSGSGGGGSGAALSGDPHAAHLQRALRHRYRP